MTLPSSGALAMSKVNEELGKTSNSRISLGDSAVRTLAGKTSGTISMSDLRGKSSWAATHTLYPRYVKAFPGVVGVERDSWAYAAPGGLVSGQVGDLSPKTLTGPGTTVTITKIEALINSAGHGAVSITYSLSPNVSSITFEFSTTTYRTPITCVGFYGSTGLTSTELFNEIKSVATANGSLAIRITAH